MEYDLREIYNYDLFLWIYQVLILILMEYDLRGIWEASKTEEMVVLILILMEYDLRDSGYCNLL